MLLSVNVASYCRIVLSAYICIFRSESPSQVFFIVLTWLIALLQSSVKPEEVQSIYLAYDNMCNLCRLKVARKPLPLKPPLDRAWLRMNKIIDSFHLRNHVNPECHTTFSPQTLKEIHPNANTQAGEQTFVGWQDTRILFVL